MQKLFAIVAFLLIYVPHGYTQTPLPKVSWGMVQRIPEFESVHIGKRCIDVLLPEEYPAYPAKRYPVLYMNDGQMLFDSSQTWNHQEWGVDEAMREFYLKNSRACIVVAVHNAGNRRYEEYFPRKAFDLLSESGKQKVLNLAGKDSNRAMRDSRPHSDEYLKFLVKELKPAIDLSFRTRPDKSHTWIAGSSMGGLISLYALCEYPETFGAAACLSTHWPGIFANKDNPVPDAFFRYMNQHLPSPASHRIYMDCGTASLDSLYPVHHRHAVKILKDKGYRSYNLKEKIVSGANHSEVAWKARMPEVLDFLLQARGRKVKP